MELAVDVPLPSQHLPVEKTTETKVNKFNKLQQTMKLGRYLHV